MIIRPPRYARKLQGAREPPKEVRSPRATLARRAALAAASTPRGKIPVSITASKALGDVLRRALDRLACCVERDGPSSVLGLVGERLRDLALHLLAPFVVTETP